MAHDHLFTTVKSFRFLSCGITDKEFVVFFGNTCCLEQALITDLLLRHLFFCLSHFRMTFPMVTACQVMRPVCQNEPQHLMMDSRWLPIDLSEKVCCLSFLLRKDLRISLNIKLCLELQMSCISLAVHLNKKLQ